MDEYAIDEAMEWSVRAEGGRVVLELAGPGAASMTGSPRPVRLVARMDPRCAHGMSDDLLRAAAAAAPKAGL